MHTMNWRVFHSRYVTAEQMLEEESDSELIALTREELRDLREQKEDLEQKSRILLIPP